MLDARRAEVDVVPRVRLFDADMVCDAQSFLVRFVFHHLHDVAIDAEELDPIHAHRLERADAGARRIGVGRPAELRIDENPRGGERAFGAGVAPSQSFPCVAPDVAYRGDAAGQPDLELVLDWLRGAGALVLQVRVRV